MLTEDDRMLDIKLDVVKEYVVERKTAEAWGLIPSACIPERGTNKPFLVITERDCAPVSLNGQNYSKKMKLMMSQIAQENASAARSSIQRKSQKNKVAETLQLLAIIFGIFVCLLVIFGLLTSGNSICLVAAVVVRGYSVLFQSGLSWCYRWAKNQASN